MTGKAVFFDSDGHKRTLDFLAQPYGLDAEDVRNRCGRRRVGGLHPHVFPRTRHGNTARATR